MASFSIGSSYVLPVRLSITVNVSLPVMVRRCHGLRRMASPECPTKGGRAPFSGLSLLPCAIVALAACATPEEADPFQPPQRPLIYGAKSDCSEVKKPAHLSP